VWPARKADLTAICEPTVKKMLSSKPHPYGSPRYIARIGYTIKAIIRPVLYLSTNNQLLTCSNSDVN
jgi:hypothetical protein